MSYFKEVECLCGAENLSREDILDADISSVVFEIMGIIERNSNYPTMGGEENDIYEEVKLRVYELYFDRLRDLL